MIVQLKRAAITAKWIENDSIRTEHFTMTGNIIREGKAKKKAKELYGVKNPMIEIIRTVDNYNIPDEIMEEVCTKYGTKIEKKAEDN